MRTIYKYQIDYPTPTSGNKYKGPCFPTEMFKTGKILSADIDLKGDLCVWVELETLTVLDLPKEDRKELRDIYVFQTGQQMPETPLRYIGTVRWSREQLMLHVFEKA